MASSSSQSQSPVKRARIDTAKQPLDFDNLFGLPLGRRAVFIEVFAGCARLSRFAQRTYTTDPSKCYPFSESFDVLGARLSVGGLHGQSFSLQNKPGRLDKIAELVSEVQRNKTITKRQAQVIHGNMNFAMSFVMGHTLKVAARAFSALSTDACVYSKKQLVSLCIWTKEILTFLSPRTIDPKGPLSPVLIFTDAAYEMDTATWGVVFIDSLTGTRTAEGGTCLG